MLIVIVLYSVFIEKDTSRLVEGNAMLSQIGLGLSRVPFKTQYIHNYIVTTYERSVNASGDNVYSLIDIIRAAREGTWSPARTMWHRCPRLSDLPFGYKLTVGGGGPTFP